MALTYQSFQTYPLQIEGIDSSFDSLISEIEAFVISDLAYSGDADDLTAILPYFVFWFFCQNCTSSANAMTGENSQVKELSEPVMFKQVNNWNTGVNMLRVLFGVTEDLLCDYLSSPLHVRIHELVLASGKTVNEKYLSKRSLL